MDEAGHKANGAAPLVTIKPLLSREDERSLSQENDRPKMSNTLGADPSFDPDHNEEVCVLERNYSPSSLCCKCDAIFSSWESIHEQMLLEPVISPFECRTEDGRTTYRAQDSSIKSAHWDNIVLLDKSAREGCHLCIQFLSQIDNNDWGQHPNKLASLYHTMVSFCVHIKWTEFVPFSWFDAPDCVSDKERIRARNIKNVTLCPSYESEDILKSYPPIYFREVDGLDTQKVISTSTGDALSLVQAEKWLRDCQQEDRTISYSSTWTNPTRLLLLNGNMVNLVISSELSGPVEYTTLSHCWGSVDLLKLLKSNMASFKDRIPWHTLARTFQESCLTIQRLGFTYIWIDSLCIIQDCSKDWATESSLMSSVYGNSSLNIAASIGINSSSGLFAERNPKSVQPLRVLLPKYTKAMVTGHTGEQIPILAWEHNQWYEFSRQLQRESCIVNTPLGHRAWTMQERLLPRRTLFYASQLAWTCHHKRDHGDINFLCETYPSGLPRDHLSLSTTNYAREIPLEHWRGLLQEYSSRKLSYETDRLVAIGGIAQKFQSLFHDDYLAGIWRRHLPDLLLWHPRNPFYTYRFKTKIPCTKQFNPPSWSWASFNGEIEHANIYAGINWEELLQVVRVRMKLDGGSSFGNVTSGELYLRSPYLVSFTMPRMQRPKFRILLEQNRTTMELPQSSPSSLLVELSYLHHEEADLGGKLFLFGGALRSWKSPDDSGRLVGALCGLILKSTGKRQAEYVRVGYFEAVVRAPTQPNFFQTVTTFGRHKEAQSKDYLGIPEVDMEGQKRYCIILV